VVREDPVRVLGERRARFGRETLGHTVGRSRGSVAVSVGGGAVGERPRAASAGGVERAG
jgi:hypothetical protein